MGVMSWTPPLDDTNPSDIAASGNPKGTECSLYFVQHLKSRSWAGIIRHIGTVMVSCLCSDDGALSQRVQRWFCSMEFRRAVGFET